MILSLFIISGLLLLGGIVFFVKRKALLGWMFLLLGIFGFVLAIVVKWLYPEIM